MEKIIHTDIFIAGAGAAGIAAATAAAGLGLEVCIAERNAYPGGRATASAVGTICGLYLRNENAAPDFAMHGFPQQFAKRLMAINGKSPAKFAKGLWFLPSLPSDFSHTAAEFLAQEKIDVRYETVVTGLEKNASSISAINCMRGEEKIKIVPQCVIDCSGEGIVCSAVNHEMIHDEEYQAAAIVFEMENISVKDEFQLTYSLLKKITQAVETNEVPAYMSLLSIVPSSLNSTSVLFKMGLPWNAESVHVDTRVTELIATLVDFIRTAIPGCEDARLKWIAKEVGVRTGLRAKGKMILRDEDVLQCKKTEDGISKGAWPVEYWRTGSKRVELTYFAENDFYTIPAGCLESGEKENLFFAGKIISAEEKAIASARVIGTCFGTGYAAGVLAAYKVKNKNRSEAIEFIRMKMNGQK